MLSWLREQWRYGKSDTKPQTGDVSHQEYEHIHNALLSQVMAFQLAILDGKLTSRIGSRTAKISGLEDRLLLASSHLLRAQGSLLSNLGDMLVQYPARSWQLKSDSESVLALTSTTLEVSERVLQRIQLSRLDPETEGEVGIEAQDIREIADSLSPIPISRVQWSYETRIPFAEYRDRFEDLLAYHEPSDALVKGLTRQTATSKRMPFL